MIFLNKYWVLLFFITVSPSLRLLAKTETAEKIPLVELQAFAEAYYQIKLNYAKPTDDADLITAAIRGMVASLDQHSRYMDKEEFKQFNAENEGEYAGIGLSLNDHQYGFEIVQVVKNGPAARAGILPNMLITHINNLSVQTMPVNEAFNLLNGKEGEKIKLTVSATSFAKPKVFELTKEIILLESVISEQLPRDTGYIAISQFTLQTYDEFLEAIRLMSTTKALKNLIIDLRNNPGGVMQVAIELSDLFIAEGKLLVSRGVSEDSNQTYYADKKTLLEYLKVVILINKSSASSSEIFASALRDHKKAVIIGETSYGKGSIQTVIPLNQQSAIKLTSAEYYSPLGHKIQDVGITPDVSFSPEVKAVSETRMNSEKTGLLDDPQVVQAYNTLFNQSQ